MVLDTQIQKYIEILDVVERLCLVRRNMLKKFNNKTAMTFGTNGAKYYSINISDDEISVYYIDGDRSNTVLNIDFNSACLGDSIIDPQVYEFDATKGDNTYDFYVILDNDDYPDVLATYNTKEKTIMIDCNIPPYANGVAIPFSTKQEIEEFVFHLNLETTSLHSEYVHKILDLIKNFNKRKIPKKTNLTIWSSKRSLAKLLEFFDEGFMA